MKNLLITGASGFLGWNLCRAARGEWVLHGFFHSNPAPLEGVRLRRVDLTGFSEVKKNILEIRPDAVIHAAAESNTNFCQLHPARSRLINVKATADLASLCADFSIPFVFISSDMVFDGLNAPYGEDDPPNPVSAYGEQKAEAERAVLLRHPRALVCRTSLMFGDAGPGTSSFIQPWIDDMKKGRELKLFHDEFRTPVSAMDAARGILIGLSNARGILHLGGPERISRLDFGTMLRDIVGLHEARISPCSQKDIQMAAPRPPDVALDSSRAVSLGYRPGPLREELLKLACVRQ